jgi:hypothetical protein
LNAINEYGYTLDVVKDIFTTAESPEDKLARIRSLSAPTENFDYRLLLDEIWRWQADESKGEAVPYNSVRQSRTAWKKMTVPEFERRLIALETLSGGQIRLQTTPREVYLVQHPDRVAENIERMVAQRKPRPAPECE